MPIQKIQQHPRRPIRRERIRRRLQTIKMILPLLIRSKLAPQIIIALVLRVLEIILPIRRGLPDIEDGIGDSLSCDEIRDGSVHARHQPVRRHVLDDAGAEVAEGSVGGPEGPEDRGGGRVDAVLGDELVGDFVDEAGGDVLVDMKRMIFDGWI
jgi:hypothetical protein